MFARKYFFSRIGRGGNCPPCTPTPTSMEGRLKRYWGGVELPKLMSDYIPEYREARVHGFSRVNLEKSRAARDFARDVQSIRATTSQMKTLGPPRPMHSHWNASILYSPPTLTPYIDRCCTVYGRSNFTNVYANFVNKKQTNRPQETAFFHRRRRRTTELFTYLLMHSVTRPHRA